MRDPNLMLKLLRDMASHDLGHKSAPMMMGMSSEEMTERHHLELLVDAGHAVWLEGKERIPSIARITNDGYDFLSAIDRGTDTKTRFIELFNNGVPYVKAALEVLKMVSA